MAVFTASVGLGLGFNNSLSNRSGFDDSRLGAYANQTANGFTLTGVSPNVAYSANGTTIGYTAGRPTTGVLNSVSQTIIGFGTTYTFTGLAVSFATLETAQAANDFTAYQSALFAGADTITGAEQADNLNGYGGADVINGGAGNDVLSGDDGDDVLYGNQDRDVSYGGLGSDTVYGGDGDDTLWHGDNRVPGLAHDDGAVDALYGEAGADSIFIGLGDFADGGADYDRVYVSFFARTTGLTLDLNTDLATATARLQAASGATLLNFEELDVYGTRFNDTLTGSARVDRLFGGEGDNILYGLADDDILSGGYGNDNLYGGTGADTFYYVGGTDFEYGEAGNDQFWLGSSFAGDTIIVGALAIDGGADIDTIDFSRLSVAVSFSLGQTAPQPVAGGTVTVVNIENVIGSNGPDLLYGTAGPNTIYGMAGNDTIVAGAGADIVYGGDGDDTIQGSSAGNQSNSPAGVNDGADMLYGEGGDDNLRGREGDDLLVGGAGDDNLRGDLGSDYLDGGEGIDFAGYRFDDIGATAGVIFNASIFGTSTDFVFADGRGGVDHLVSVERVGVVGTPFGDVLTVGQAGGQATGLLGDDLIVGGAGGDILSGNDLTPGVDGGVDTVSYATATAGVTVSLLVQDGTYQNTTGAGSDRLTNFDNLIGSAFADMLTGDGAANVLTGGSGADTLSGGSGDDILYGNQDNDVLYGNQGADTLYGGQGNDALYGGQGDDSMFSNAGDDLLEGGAGINRVDGGDGIDTAAYAFAASGVSISLALQGQLQATGISTDLLIGIENLTGSTFADALTGDASANFLQGGVGADTMSGGAGNDILFGGADNDVLYGNQDSDSLYGGAGGDALYGGQGDDFIIGGAGADVLFGNLGADTFQYFATSDSPVGGSDLIADFTSGVDKIELRPIHTGGAADVFSLTQINGVTYLNVDLGNDGSIEMQIVITGTVLASDVIWT